MVVKGNVFGVGVSIMMDATDIVHIIVDGFILKTLLMVHL